MKEKLISMLIRTVGLRVRDEGLRPALTPNPDWNRRLRTADVPGEHRTP